MTFLVLDIGNTRLKWAMYEGTQPDSPILAWGAEFLDNIDTLAEKSWQNLPEPRQILGCSVTAEAIKRRVLTQLELWDTLPQWVVACESEAGLINGYDHPSRLGADRWVAMIGARQRIVSQGQKVPIILAMVGTAVTVEAIDEKGYFLGGLILPGHGIMLKALESGTAGLHVPTGDVVAFPKNTSDALTSGGTYAIAGAVERMVQHVFAHCKQMPVCLMTGGAGWKMAPSMTRPFELVENLIFEGLLAIARHRDSARGMLNN